MRSVTLGRILDIPIRVNLSLVLFLPILVWLIAGQVEAYGTLVNVVSPIEVDTDLVTGGSTPWVIGTAAAAGLFVGVLLHELGHSVVAMRYEIPIASITLWIFGGLARMQNLPEDWSTEFWIALAGPATSVLVAGACFAALFVLPPSAPPVLVFVVAWLAAINLALAGFNLLPAFPMDGGRIFRALLARRRPYVEATAIAARAGRIFGMGMVLVGVLTLSPLLALVGFFVYVAAGAESRVTTLRDLLRDVTADDLLRGQARTVREDTTVRALLERMLDDRRTGYPVVDEEGRLVGLVSLRTLRSVPSPERAGTTVADVMAESPPVVSPAAPAFAVLELLAGSTADRVVVLEGEHIRGTLDTDDVVSYIDLVQGIGPIDRPEDLDLAPPDGYA